MIQLKVLEIMMEMNRTQKMKRMLVADGAEGAMLEIVGKTEEMNSNEDNLKNFSIYLI